MERCFLKLALLGTDLAAGALFGSVGDGSVPIYAAMLLGCCSLIPALNRLADRIVGAPQ